MARKTVRRSANKRGRSPASIRIELVGWRKSLVDELVAATGLSRRKIVCELLDSALCNEVSPIRDLLGGGLGTDDEDACGGKCKGVGQQATTTRNETCP